MKTQPADCSQSQKRDRRGCIAMIDFNFPAILFCLFIVAKLGYRVGQ